jgi:hypothetical protein
LCGIVCRETRDIAGNAAGIEAFAKEFVDLQPDDTRSDRSRDPRPCPPRRSARKRATDTRINSSLFPGPDEIANGAAIISLRT